MTSTSRTFLAAVVAAVLLTAVVAVPGSRGGFRGLAAPATDAPTLRYIVELTDPPLARYEGGIGKLAPTAAYLAGDVHLSLDTPAAAAYLAHLDRAQGLARARIAAVAPGARFDWTYRYVLNGFAATLTPDQAARVRRLPGVRALQPEEELEADLDASLPLVGADEACEWVGGDAEAGLGARIAIVDAGTDSRHPMFTDDGMPAPPTGYPTATMHLRDGSVHAYPNADALVNGKLIAARVFVSPQSLGALTVVSALQQLSPLGQGHGLHVSGIAAGRLGTYPSLHAAQVVPVTASGVAPMAQVLNYMANYAATPEYVAMLEQMVVDRVDVLNMSQGHVGWLVDQPDRHVLTHAFDGAADAGIVVVISAGNAGSNGATSLSGSFKYSPKVLAVGNTSTPGSYGVPVAVSGAGRPFDHVTAAARGNFTHTASIAGELYLAPEGGCVPATGAAGRIAVIDRAVQREACSYEQRAVTMKDSGARGAIYVYDDRELGGFSSTRMPLPTVALGTRGGTELLAWLRTSPADARATISASVVRGSDEPSDQLVATSSRGPGLAWEIKPDISAPGSDILSSQYFRGPDGQMLAGVASMGGTSMSSPHVAGAAALLRSAHPTWTSAQVRSALVTTAAPSITSDGRPAPPHAGGPGRLDVAAALDPGAFAEPTSLGFGDLEAGVPKVITVTLHGASPVTETWTASVVAVTGTAPVAPIEPLVVTPGASARLTVTLAPGTAEEHYGHVVLRRSADRPDLRLAYYAHVTDPAVRRDVLLVDWTWGDGAYDTPDHAGYYTRTLETLGLTYDVWRIDQLPQSADNRRAHPPLSVLKRYDLVILNTNESRYPLQYMVSGMPFGSYQYQNYLLGGGNMLIVGQGEMNWWRILSKATYPPANRAACAGTFPRCMIGPSQNGGCDMCLPRYFAGFTFGVTSTLAGRVLTYPERPPTPTLEVVLPPHSDADGAFPYALDLSTGDMARDGSAGNQYTFASGGVLSGYIPSGDTLIEGRDQSFVETVIDRVAPHARPLWSYTGPFEEPTGQVVTTTKVVGTYIAGRHDPEARIAWNAMFWGFGLEGVGKGADGTQGRDRLLGDAYNFLAHNLRADLVTASFDRDGLSLAFPPVADLPTIGRIAVDWGDGTPPETVSLETPLRADLLRLPHDYAVEADYDVRVDLHPVADAAPIYGIAGRVHGLPALTYNFLPLALDRFEASASPSVQP